MKLYVFVLISFFILCNSAHGQDYITIGSTAPRISFDYTYPSVYRLPENKAIILDFWATWCGPCVFNLLEQNSIIAKYSNVIDFIAITDSTSQNIEGFIKNKKLKHNFIVDNAGKTQKRYFVTAIPFCYVIDKNHIIQWKGSPSKLTTIMIDEFINTGIIKSDNNITTIKNSKNNKITDSTHHSTKLIINELPIKNFD